MDRALIAARREIALVGALADIAMFRPQRHHPVVVPGPALPITEAEVAAWIAEHPFRRGHLAPHVARSLAYLDRFRGQPP